MTRTLRLLPLLFCLTLPVAAPAQDAEDDGGGRLERLIEGALSGAGRNVQISGFRGLLSSEATLDRMTISDDQGVWLTLENATLEWTRTALLRGALEVNELTAERLEIARAPIASPEAPAPEASGGFSLPELPVSVNVGELGIDRVELGASLIGEPLALQLQGSAELAGGEGDATLQVTRIDGTQGDITLAGSYANDTGQLALDLSVEEGAGGIITRKMNLPDAPPLSLTLQGEGPVDDFTADLALVIDDAEHVEGQITLRGQEDGGQAFAADVTGDLRPLLPEEQRAFMGAEQALQVSGLLGADGAIDLDTLALTTAQLQLEGSARIGADRWPEVLQLDGRIASEDGEPVRLAFTEDATLLDGATLALDYDRSQGDSFTLDVVAQGLDRSEMSLAEARIAGRGTITRSAGESLPGAVRGALTLDLEGLQFADAALARATGPAMQGRLDFDWQPDEPLTLADIDLQGAGLQLVGDVVFSGLTAGEDPAIEPDLRLDADDISRFSGLAGQQLEGAADVALAGRVEPLAGRFDLTLNGRTVDLASGIEQLDPLLAGIVSLDAAVARDEEGTVLRELVLNGDHLNLDAFARLQTDGSTGTLEAELSDLSLIDPSLSGAATIQGDLSETPEAYSLDFTASAPGGTDAQGTVTAEKSESGIAAVGFDGQAAADDLSVYSAIAGRELGGSATFDGQARYALDGGAFSAEGDLATLDVRVGIPEVDGLLAGRTEMTVAVDRDADGIVLRTLRAQGPAIDLDAEGRIVEGASTGTFTLRLPELSRIRDGLSGALALDGTLEETAEAYVVDFTASGPGSTEADGVVQAEKSEGGVAALAFDGRAAVANLAAYAPLLQRELGGGADFDGAARYELDTGHFSAAGDLVTQDIRAGIPEVDGLLAGRTVMQVDAERNESGIVLRTLNAEGPAITLDAEGRITDGASNGTFTLRLPELSRIRSGLSGALALDGTLEETADALLLDFTASGPGGTDASGRVSAEKLGEGYADIGLIRFTGQAGAESLSAYAPLVGRPLSGGVSFDGTAAYALPDGSFDVDGRLTTRNLALGIPTADRLLAGTGTVQVTAARDAEGAITIERLNAETPEITATATGDIGPAQGSVRYDVALRDLGVVVPQFPGRATAQGTLSFSGDGPWQVDTSATGPAGITLNADGSVARDFGSANLGLNGNVPLALINRFAEPNLFEGTAQLNLRLDGPLAPSSLSGTVRVANGQAVLPGPALTITDLAIDAELGGGQVRPVVTGNLASGGRLRVEGTVGLDAPYPAALQVRGRNLIFEDRRLYQAEADADITVEGPLLTGPRVAGRIGIVNAEIRVPETGMGPGSRSFTLTHINEPGPVHVTRERAGLVQQESARSGPTYSLPLDLTIDAPNRIFVRGRGLDAELGGQLTLTGSSTNIVPQGRFELIRGRLDILGQRLTLDEAILTLQDGTFIPTINVTATTERDGVDITIGIEGEATSPDVSFSSSPNRPEDEVLALLLFGRDISELSALQALRIAAAVNTLAGRGGTGIIENLRLGFGVDDLDVTTDEDGNAGLRVGKYINENLYTDVEVNSEGETEVNLNLNVTSDITARGSVESTGNTSIGIFFERDY
ncbi:translocation/assembly module TamB domain-containing protein [Salipiger mucosus]|uniref:Translocation and assembly module TamB C-terminal domain-containing protein n=1 Tax=Salipiger mucosus DSM 16094 TaxID=1123237 RepID=S9Q8I1_9RHOB|nr:translocation/assembly module TamB domain-containing protein [Salipiger mucosus]EPX75938.1 hypothetical protein Salmuc_02334 [Salipiger mucosus DSM 16094]